ncbi:MAG: hypothetical protein KDE20_23860, partial [Caldilineaceae bacterium]|nr:hypothetical protein [Caldilineaceae bacterium]
MFTNVEHLAAAAPRCRATRRAGVIQRAATRAQLPCRGVALGGLQFLVGKRDLVFVENDFALC